MILGDVHFCMAEVSIITNDVESALSHARKSLEIFDKHDRNGWRFAQAQNELSEAYISAGMYEHAIEQADLAIVSYSVLEEPEYADWAQMNKGLSLCNLGRYDDASTVIADYLNYREQEFGPMDTESFKYDSSPFIGHTY